MGTPKQKDLTLPFDYILSPSKHPKQARCGAQDLSWSPIFKPKYTKYTFSIKTVIFLCYFFTTNSPQIQQKLSEEFTQPLEVIFETHVTKVGTEINK